MAVKWTTRLNCFIFGHVTKRGEVFRTQAIGSASVSGGDTGKCMYCGKPYVTYRHLGGDSW